MTGGMLSSSASHVQIHQSNHPLPPMLVTGTLLFLAVAVLPPVPASAVSQPDTLRPRVAAPLSIPATSIDDDLRLRQLLAASPTDGYLIRSTSFPAAVVRQGVRRLAWRPLLPRIETTWNSEIASSFNNGGMWAGRGLSARIVGGAAARSGPFTVVLAPELSRSFNRDFEFVDSRVPGLSPMIPPWRTGGGSADLPLRFGTEPFTTIFPGESSLTVDIGPVSAGFATESQWWGPGIRNALVLSSNAPGIPHGFLRTARPLATPAGDIEGKWITGTLTESLFFDDDPANDYRFLSAFVLTLRPVWTPQLTVGFSRAVYGNLDRPSSVFGHALDAVTRWDQREVPGDELSRNRSEQISALFWRWVLPAGGVEAYGEWARTELPVDLRDLLLAPYHSQGYTLGLQWLSREAGPGRLRVQAELTNLESSEKIGGRPSRGFYSSSRVPQGYTHRGQVVGASIGPGSSSQWIAADFIGARAHVGLFGSRVRWDDDAFYTRPVRDRHLAHDVSFIAGVRGGLRLGGTEVTAEFMRDYRMNYLFQNDAYWFDQEQGVDVTNYSLRLSVGPALPRR
jgi:hypothetical protein